MGSDKVRLDRLTAFEYDDGGNSLIVELPSTTRRVSAT
jgi:hypothetical protein